MKTLIRLLLWVCIVCPDLSVQKIRVIYGILINLNIAEQPGLSLTWLETKKMFSVTRFNLEKCNSEEEIMCVFDDI